MKWMVSSIANTEVHERGIQFHSTVLTQQTADDVTGNTQNAVTHPLLCCSWFHFRQKTNVERQEYFKQRHKALAWQRNEKAGRKTQMKRNLKADNIKYGRLGPKHQQCAGRCAQCDTVCVNRHIRTQHHVTKLQQIIRTINFIPISNISNTASRGAFYTNSAQPAVYVQRTAQPYVPMRNTHAFHERKTEYINTTDDRKLRLRNYLPRVGANLFAYILPSITITSQDMQAQPRNSDALEYVALGPRL